MVLRVVVPSLQRPPRDFLHRPADVRREFVREGFGVEEALVRVAQGVSAAAARGSGEGVVGGGGVWVCRVVCGGFKLIFGEDGEWGGV